MLKEENCPSYQKSQRSQENENNAIISGLRLKFQLDWFIDDMKVNKQLE